MANRTGERRQRELVNRLNDTGFAVLRAPASGSATDRNLPDVLAGNGESVYAIEAKSSNGNPNYLDGSEVDALEFFAENFGAKPGSGSVSNRRSGLSSSLTTSMSLRVGAMG